METVFVDVLFLFYRLAIPAFSPPPASRTVLVSWWHPLHPHPFSYRQHETHTQRHSTRVLPEGLLSCCA